jgi:hypothetical protein
VAIRDHDVQRVWIEMCGNSDRYVLELAVIESAAF